jgi:hypothetical protein
MVQRNFDIRCSTVLNPYLAASMQSGLSWPHQWVVLIRKDWPAHCQQEALQCPFVHSSEYRVQRRSTYIPRATLRRNIFILSRLILVASRIVARKARAGVSADVFLCICGLSRHSDFWRVLWIMNDLGQIRFETKRDRVQLEPPWPMVWPPFVPQELWEQTGIFAAIRSARPDVG